MSVASQQRHPFNDDFSRGNRLNSAGTSSGEWGCSSVITLFFAMKPLTKTDQFAGALLWRINQLSILHFSGCLLLTTSLRRRRTSMYISIYTLAIPINYTSEFWELLEVTANTCGCDEWALSAQTTGLQYYLCFEHLTHIHNCTTENDVAGRDSSTLQRRRGWKHRSYHNMCN